MISNGGGTGTNVIQSGVSVIYEVCTPREERIQELPGRIIEVRGGCCLDDRNTYNSLLWGPLYELYAKRCYLRDSVGKVLDGWGT